VEKKFQIFVSSTFEDLRVPRDRVIQGILEMGHIPVGMEMFSAADDEQWKIIARHIEESDYYVVILGHRYGSRTGGISYTRKEYQHALASGIPVLGFVIDASIPWPPEYIDIDSDDVAALNNFKTLVESKPVGYWSSADDLYGKSSIALVKAIAANPRTGWVRGDTVADPSVANEISRLSAENARLRAQVEGENQTADLELAFEGDRETLRRHKRTISVRVEAHGDWEDGTNLSLFQIFDSLRSELVIESSSSSLRSLLAVVGGKEDQKGLTVPLNMLHELMTEFLALDLVEPSTRKHAVADKDVYWSLSERGRLFVKWYKRRELQEPLETSGGGIANSDGPSSRPGSETIE
jgi:hypothetical protein